MKRNTTILLPTLLVLCMALALLTGTALAAEVTYAVEGGNLHFYTEIGTIARCDESVTRADIPAAINGVAVTDIGGFGEEYEAGAFQDCKSLTDVYYGGSQSNWEEISINKVDAANAALLAATIHYNSVSPAPAVPNAPQQTPAANSVGVTVNGNAVQWPDATPFIDTNNRTMVPLRAVADAIGLDVRWQPVTKEASFANGGKTLTFPIGSNTARGSDGTTITMNTAAVVVSGRTYAPVRYLAEFFGYQVDWDANSRTVIITG